MAEGALNRSPQEDGRRCCLCDGAEFRLLHQWEADHPRNSATVPLSVWECRCGLAVLHPIPTPEVLPQAGEWWTGKRKFVRRFPLLKKIRKPLQNFFFGEQKERLVRQTRHAVSSGKLLDIGCGTGKLLTIASKWYECEGVELSERAVKECEKQGFNVKQGFFENVEFEPESYDVAVMDAVLEHVYDPVQVLKKVNQVLKPGGVVAVKVPKLWGPAHRLHGREWNGYRVGYHTYLYTGKTLGLAMRLSGFEVLSSPKRDRPMDDLLALWGRKPRNASSPGTSSRAA